MNPPPDAPQLPPKNTNHFCCKCNEWTDHCTGQHQAVPVKEGEDDIVLMKSDELESHLAEPPVTGTQRPEGSKDLYEAIQRLATMVGYSLQSGWHMEDWEIPLVVDIARMSIGNKCASIKSI